MGGWDWKRRRSWDGYIRSFEREMFYSLGRAPWKSRILSGSSVVWRRLSEGSLIWAWLRAKIIPDLFPLNQTAAGRTESLTRQYKCNYKCWTCDILIINPNKADQIVWKNMPGMSGPSIGQEETETMITSVGCCGKMDAATNVKSA